MSALITYCLNCLATRRQVPKYEPTPLTELVITQPQRALREQFGCKRIDYFKQLLKVKNINASEESMHRILQNFQSIDDIYNDKIKRRSFINMSYVARKLFELEEGHDILGNFNILSHRTIQSYDTVWEKICFELKWKYNSTKKSKKKSESESWTLL